MLEHLKVRNMTQTDLAAMMKRPIKTINEIVHGKARITVHTAIQLEKALKVDATLWLYWEADYRLSLARQQRTSKLTKPKDT